MQSNDTSNDQKIILKCKPFTVLSAEPPHSSPKTTSARRSTRIASRRNDENVMEGSGQTAQLKRNGVQCSSSEDDVVRQRRTTQKRRNQNRIKSSDDDDNDIVTGTVKKRSPKKRRSQSNAQSDGVDVSEPKKKTPIKRRKPLLTIKCNKITDYFGKSTVTTASAATNRIEDVPSVSEPVTPPSDVIVLSSSDELDADNVEEQPKAKTPPQPPAPPQQVVLTTPKRKALKCPEYKIVAGTNFAVDAFRYGDLDGVAAYFLTHFHSDHYNGLNRKFNHPIYMSSVTGRLVQAILKVNGRLIRTMNINQSYVIDGVEVTPIDANHCPGAVMFIFKLQCGRTILHTGDFRATPEMESNPVFWNNNISTIYLDTTYLHKSYNFGTQNDALLFVEDEIRKFKQKAAGKKFVVVVGSYMVGKERVWAHIAQTFNMKVWLEDERRKAFDLIYTEENDNQIIKNCICDARDEAQLHVIPIQCVNYAFLMDYLKNFRDHVLLAFRPTGWAQNTKPQYGSRVSIVGVQYSEHSSYSELERFVRFVQPETVISTVPISSGNANTKKVPAAWLSVPKPMKSSQSTMTSFMKLRKTSCPVIDKLTGNLGGSGHHDQQQQLILDDAGSYDSLETDYMP
ncbi:DNA cross-link repair protein SNM1-like isoform X2 [Bradysia coprophila]|uniref:DNA cross-link repair protein SNM1-like isoform X2 n=1 Tax=Bradysia coprophila TaxID=38358 RepID=UPI00187DD05C|nr:DNA cross-link repair protein SNM1-like isoform X2 [Bradysia coprophila]